MESVFCLAIHITPGKLELVKEEYPLMMIPALEFEGEWKTRTLAKAFVASLMRSLFTGSIRLFRNREMPLFKIEPRQLDEVYVSLPIPEKGAVGRFRALDEFLKLLGKQSDISPRRWVIIADVATLALRNIDYLFPSDTDGPFPSSQADFYWAETAEGEYVPGFWAVRGEHLGHVAGSWNAMRCIADDGGPDAGRLLWKRFVQDLKLSKKRFELGALSAPRPSSLNWEEVASSALISVQDWPAGEQSKFIQSLYLGTYLGDESGMIMDVLNS